MESANNLLKKVKDWTKRNLLKIVLSFVFLIIVAIVLFFVLRPKPVKSDFYPYSEKPRLQKIASLFVRKDDLNLITYINQVLPSMSEEDKKLALFYKAEVFFRREEIPGAWKIYLYLARVYPKLWQAKFRLGCLHFLKKEYEPAKKIIFSVQKDVPQVLFWKGRYFEEMGEKKKAAYYYSKILSDPKAVYRTAKLYLDAKDYKKASSFYTHLYEGYGTYKKIILKDLLTSLWNYAQSLKDPKEKKVIYEKILTYVQEQSYKKREDLEIEKYKGWALLGLQKDEEAYLVLSYPLIYRNDQKVIKALAYLSFKLKKYQKSLEFFRILEKDLKDKEKMIEVLMKLDQYKEASNALLSLMNTEDIRIKEQWVKIYRLLIECFLQVEDMQQAKRYGLLLIQKEPSAENYLLMAKIYQQSADSNGYLAALKEAGKRKAKYVPLLIKSLIDVKNYAEAELILNKILKKTPYHETALFYRSQIWLKQKRWEYAKVDLYNLIYLPPKDKSIYEKALYSLGSLLLYENKVEQGKQMFLKAVELNPGSAESSLKLSEIYLHEKRYKKAKELLLKVKIKEGLSNSFLSKVYSYLSFCEKKSGNFDQARLYVDRALELNPANAFAKNLMKGF